MNYLNKLIGGKDRGLKFNQGTLMTFYSKVDNSNFAATSSYALVWAALKSNAYVKGEEFTENFETVCDWVDELSTETKVEIMKVFQESTAFESLQPKKKTAGETTRIQETSTPKTTKRSATK